MPRALSQPRHRTARRLSDRQPSTDCSLAAALLTTRLAILIRRCTGELVGDTTMSNAREGDVANRLWDASLSKMPCAPVRNDLGKDNIAGAYRVQYANAHRRIAGGGTQVGFKVGMTSAAVQQQLGYFEPNFGHLFGDREFINGSSIPDGTLIQPRGEGEIAFVLGKDLAQTKVRMTDVIRAVEYAVCSIELLDSRIKGWDIGPVDSIADNGSGGAHVLGTFARKVSDCDLALCGMVAKLNGQIASLGVGAASMIHSWRCAGWPRSLR